ncbi:hypothetical protein SUGI_1148890 [Cryptomeria japonica]|nr:hypothetical protein SUGI_1148890 [Cryptomeria japonica]
MSLPFNGRKGGLTEDVRLDFTKELKEDLVFWEDYTVIAKIIGLNWPRKEIRNWVECNWGKRTVIKFIAKGFFVVLFEEKEERNRALIDRNWFIKSHVVYIQPWTPHFDPTRLVVYSEPVWIRLYNLPIEYWSEDLWEKIGRTLGTLLETDYDDEKDICKCARLRIATIKRVPERITLISDHGEWSQKVEIDKEISRCPRCGNERKKTIENQEKIQNGEDEQSLETERIETVSPQKEIVGGPENMMEILKEVELEDGEINQKIFNVESSGEKLKGSRINTEEVLRDSNIIMKGLSDTEFEYERGIDEEIYQIDELENIDPRSISQSANVLLGKTKGLRGRRSNKQKREDRAKEKGITGVLDYIKKTKGGGISLGNQ